MEVRQKNFLIAEGYTPGQINTLKQQIQNPYRTL